MKDKVKCLNVDNKFNTPCGILTNGTTRMHVISM